VVRFTVVLLMGLGVCGSLCQGWFALREECGAFRKPNGRLQPRGIFVKRLRSDTLLGHLGSGQWGVSLSGQKGNHDLWVKCTTFAECYETDISAMLAVMSGQGSSID
jgi:hypothetical protein